MTAPQPTPDSRVAKVVAEIDCLPGFAKDMLADIEAAGLLVLDPDDDLTIARIINTWWAYPHPSETTDRMRAALRGSR